jgi:transcription antitermination factor NusG
MPLDLQPGSQLDAPSRETQPHLRCYSIRARWACVYTHPQAEFWANANLKRAGYRTYLPTCAVQRRDRVIPTLRHTVTVPLFSRYLFLRFNHRAESWSPVRAAPGVADLVRSGPDLHYASDEAVDALQAAQALSATQPPENAQWAPGASCSLATGAFSGHPAVVLSVTRQTATVALLLFGTLRNVTVGVDCLVARDE